MRLTLDGICKVGFGVELDTLHPSLPAVPFAVHFDNANEAVTYRFFDPLWRLKRLLNVGSEAVLARSVKVVDDFTYKVIRTRRAELKIDTSLGKQQVGPHFRTSALVASILTGLSFSHLNIGKSNP